MKREIEETKRRLDEQVKAAAAAEEEARRARLLRPRVEDDDEEREPHRGGRGAREDERQKKRVRLEDDQPPVAAPPARATARPLAAVEASSSSSTPLQQDRFRPSLATAKPAPRTPTMTFHTKRALDKVLPLFADGADDGAPRDETTSLTAALRGGFLQDAAPSRESLAGVGGGRHAHGDAPPTPTVTMNTRAAMANVMSMFSGDFDDDTRALGDATLSSIPIEDRENAAPARSRGASGRSAAAKSAQTPGAVAPARKGLGLAVQPTKKTNREVLQEELAAKENRQAAANVPRFEPAHNKRTYGDAVREVIAARNQGEEPDEITSNLSWDDTGLLPAGALAQAPSAGGFQIYEDEQGSPVPLKQQGAGALRPPKLDFAVFDDGAQEGDGADTASLLTLPVLQKPQAASFAIFSDFDDNPPASSTAQATGGGGGGKRQPADERLGQVKQKASVVDPWLLSEEKRLLQLLGDKVTRYPNFFDCRPEKAPGRNILKVPRGRRVSSVAEPQLELPEVCIEVEERVGEGAFATVFKVDIIECSFIDLEGGETNAALKVLNEPSLWEWYIHHQILERIPRNLHHNFVRFHSIHMYSDKALTLMQFSDGTLQDAMNCFHKMNKRMDEPLIIYYTLEMLKIIEILHGAGIIHGDIKPDNFLIKNNPGVELDDWGSGSAGWDGKGLVLIDYGRSIDTRLYPEGTVFNSGNHVEGFKCTEMTEGRPWTYQADLFGICGVVHCLLHGNFIDVIRDPRTKDLMPKMPFKRYHQADLWRPLFRDFLNITDCNNIPDVSQHRRRFEEHLKKNPPKAKTIKTLLARQNILMFERDKKQK